MESSLNYECYRSDLSQRWKVQYKSVNGLAGYVLFEDIADAISYAKCLQDDPDTSQVCIERVWVLD
jgi:hypothetical protein